MTVSNLFFSRNHIQEGGFTMGGTSFLSGEDPWGWGGGGHQL